MPNNLDNIIRGIIRGYGYSRGWRGKTHPQGEYVPQGNIGGRNARSRGKPAYPVGYDMAPEANTNDDEGFQVASEPMDENNQPLDRMDYEMPSNFSENKWFRGLAAAGALAAATPAGTTSTSIPPKSLPKPTVGFGDVAAAGGKDVPTVKTVIDHIRDASRETGIQPELIKAIMWVESANDPAALSPRGARGAMQLMPKTAIEMGVSDPHDLRQGVFGGARYLQRLANIYHGNLIKVIAAYNAGPARIKGFQLDEWPDETREYLKRVLKLLPRNFKKVRYRPLTRAGSKHHSPIAEGGPIDRMTGNTDLSGKQERTPELDDAVMKNGGDPHEPDAHGKFAEGLSVMIGGTLMGYLAEDRATTVGVTVGSFQPFHAGHAAIIRAMCGQFPKVVIFVSKLWRGHDNPFSYETRMALMKASLKDVWDKIEIYPAAIDGRASDYIPGLCLNVARTQQSTLNQNSNVTVAVGEDRFNDARKQVEYNDSHHGTVGTFPGRMSVQSLRGVSFDDANVGRISGIRVREALMDDDKDMVRKMFDPLLSSDESAFEKLYGTMRAELGATGNKTAKVVTDAPIPAHHDEELGESMSAGAMATTVGDTRTGRHGGSAWSSYNPRNKGSDGDLYFQQMLKSPTTRMLDMTYGGVPNDHLPGEILDHHLDDPDDPSRADTLSDPTDLSEMIAGKFIDIVQFKM